MSVLACSRAGCHNIMCDRLSKDYGYICDECFTEYLLSVGVPAHAFMNTLKGISLAMPNSIEHEERAEKEFSRQDA